MGRGAWRSAQRDIGVEAFVPTCRVWGVFDNNFDVATFLYLHL